MCVWLPAIGIISTIDFVSIVKFNALPIARVVLAKKIKIPDKPWYLGVGPEVWK